MKKITYLLSAVIGASLFAGTIPTAPAKNILAKYTPENQKMIKLGEDIINNTNTHPLSKAFVGNDLTCSHCHIDGGKKPTIGSFVGTATIFPTFTSRKETVQTLQDRILSCFPRSMNGKRPEVDTKVVIAMTSYITYLSNGLPIVAEPYNSATNPYYAKVWHEGSKKFMAMAKKATHKDYESGKKLYAAQCASCHQADGTGVKNTFPPVWGDRSHNIAAGLGQLHKLPTWLKANMPMGAEGTLSDKQAFDLAVYVNAQPRPSIDLMKRLDGYRDNINASKKVKDSRGKNTVRSHYEFYGLDVDVIRGDKLIPKD